MLYRFRKVTPLLTIFWWGKRRLSETLQGTAFHASQGVHPHRLLWIFVSLPNNPPHSLFSTSDIHLGGIDFLHRNYNDPFESIAAFSGHTNNKRLKVIEQQYRSKWNTIGGQTRRHRIENVMHYVRPVVMLYIISISLHRVLCRLKPYPSSGDINQFHISQERRVGFFWTTSSRPPCFLASFPFPRLLSLDVSYRLMSHIALFDTKPPRYWQCNRAIIFDRWWCILISSLRVGHHHEMTKIHGEKR